MAQSLEGGIFFLQFRKEGIRIKCNIIAARYLPLSLFEALNQGALILLGDFGEVRFLELRRLQAFRGDAGRGHKQNIAPGRGDRQRRRVNRIAR